MEPVHRPRNPRKSAEICPLRIGKNCYNFPIHSKPFGLVGASPSGKASVFGTDIRRFDPSRPSHLHTLPPYSERNSPVRPAIRGLCAGCPFRHTTENRAFQPETPSSLSCEIFCVAALGSWPHAALGTRTSRTLSLPRSSEIFARPYPIRPATRGSSTVVAASTYILPLSALWACLTVNNTD